MSARVNLALAIDVLQGMYNSIEIKALAVPQGGDWIAAFLKIRFTRESVEELREKHQQKQEQLVEIPKGNKVKIFLHAMEIRGKDQLLRHVMSDGYLMLEGLKIMLPGTEWQELPASDVHNSEKIPPLEVHQFISKPDESEGYPFLFGMSSKGSERIRNILHAATKDGMDVGINDDEIASWLSLPNLDFTMNVCVILPLYFRKTMMTVASSANQIAEYEMHPALIKSCDVYAIRYSSGSLLKKQKMESPTVDAGASDVAVPVPIKVDNRALAQNEYFVVEIRHNKLGVLLNKRFYEDDLPTDASQTEASLLKVFRLFEASSELRKFLLGKREEQEPASSWLFGLLGFKVVCLTFKNSYEKMYDARGKEVGSCDLIVQDPDTGTILVVDVTQSRPDDNKRDAIRGTAKFVTKQTGINVIPVIIAGLECEDIKRNLQSDIVSVIDSADITRILDLIDKGDVKGAHDLLMGFVQKTQSYISPFG